MLLRPTLAIVIASLVTHYPADAAPAIEPLIGFETGPLADGLTKAPMYLHSNGDFYGTTPNGGAGATGTMFRMSQSGLMSGISFSAPLQGANAMSTPALASDGWLWGTTYGPTTGTIYRAHPQTGEVQTVYKFVTASGVNPQAGLVSDGQGSFWGVTRLTNTANPSNNTNGVIFRINELTGAYTVAKVFPGTDTDYAQGRAPLAALYYDGAGNLWGGTSEGGTFASGTIFKYTISTNTLAVLTSFRTNNSQTGGTPGGGIDTPLVPDGNGFLWGVTPSGGASGNGTVFKVEMATNTVTKVLDFTDTGSANKGRLPIGPLAPDGAGNLWGVTHFGSQTDTGTVFKIATTTGALTTVQNLGFQVGANPPQNGLTPDGKGYMWGIGAQGLSTSPWSVYKIKISDGIYTKVTETQPGFDSPNGYVSNTGRTPLAGLAGHASSTWLWGTTSAGGPSNAGTLFRYEPASGKHEIIANFVGQSSVVVGTSVAVGTKPTGQLCVEANGVVWGTTQKGGAFSTSTNNKSQSGTIFKYDSALGTFSTIFNFSHAIGEFPKGGLTKMSDGFIWGTTSDGGPNFGGSVFKINPATNAVTTVCNFNSSTSTNGTYPECGLAEGPGGFVWGVTKAGGTNGSGVLFKIEISTGIFTVAASLPSSYGNTVGNIVIDASGNVWAANVSFVYKFTTATSTFTNVFTREASAVPRKGISLGSLSKTAAGKIRFLGTEENAFVGNTSRGTARAVIYQIDPATSVVSKLQSLSEAGADFFNTQDINPKITLLPAGGLYEHTDGRFYGLSQLGGTDAKLNPTGGGMIYRVGSGPAAMTQPENTLEIYGTSIFNQSLTLRGYVNPNGNTTTCQFEWGPTSALGTTIAASATPGTDFIGQICEAPLTNLAPNTTYFFRLRANSTGAPSFGPILTAKTGAFLPVPTNAEISVESPLGQPLIDNVTTVNLGSRLVGRPYQQAVVVRNLSTGTGAGILSGLSASISGPNAGDFVISTPLAVASLTSTNQASVGLSISFNASASGARTALLTITSNDSDETSFEVPLTGTGLNEPEIEVDSPIAAALQSNVGTYDFGVNGITTTHAGAPRTFTIRNTGNAPLSSLNVTVAGANSSEFTVTAQPSSNISPGSSGTFTVSFAPTGEGIRNATLQIANNDSDENPFIIKITSLGILAPEIEMADGTTNLIAGVSTIDFGIVAVGTPVTKTITLSNVGSKVLTGIARQYVGASIPDFTATAPVTSLAAASQTTFTVTFTPQNANLRTRTLRIISDDSDENPFDIFLVGGPPPLTAIQSWRQLWFMSPDNTGNGADNADPDNDGLKNFMEFALNTAPNSSIAPIFQTTITGGNIEFTYTRSKAAVNAGVIFQVPWIENLTSSTWNYADTVQTVLNDNGTIQTVKATVPMGTSGHRFVRIEVK